MKLGKCYIRLQRSYLTSFWGLGCFYNLLYSPKVNSFTIALIWVKITVSWRGNEVESDIEL